MVQFELMMEGVWWRRMWVRLGLGMGFDGGIGGVVEIGGGVVIAVGMLVVV